MTTSGDGPHVDWALTEMRLDILRDHCGDLCDTTKSVSKDRFRFKKGPIIWSFLFLIIRLCKIFLTLKRLLRTQEISWGPSQPRNWHKYSVKEYKNLFLDWLSQTFHFAWKTFWLVCYAEGKIIAQIPFFFFVNNFPFSLLCGKIFLSISRECRHLMTGRTTFIWVTISIKSVGLINMLN